MKVTMVQVEFSLKRGMSNYSSRGAEVLLAADVEAGEDYREVLASLFGEAERAATTQVKLPRERGELAD